MVEQYALERCREETIGGTLPWGHERGVPQQLAATETLHRTTQRFWVDYSADGTMRFIMTQGREFATHWNGRASFGVCDGDGESASSSTSLSC
jgi:hypothetical protein